MFFVVLFVISVNIRLISVPDLLPKRRLEHTTNWSVIWHDFDVIESSRRRREEREERKNDKRIVATEESLKGSRKESLVERDSTCPTLLGLRQEDGAVRPEKRKVLDTQQRDIVGDIKASLVVKKKLAVEKKRKKETPA